MAPANTTPAATTTGNKTVSTIPSSDGLFARGGRRTPSPPPFPTIDQDRVFQNLPAKHSTPQRSDTATAMLTNSVVPSQSNNANAKDQIDLITTMLLPAEFRMFRYCHGYAHQERSVPEIQ
mmetsp:Transcript_10419/g.16540  ORF Transcript_10419/g.16540 Transcript_10419/m.16540 type:complete len:121 (+) Transcript_10419:1738-2100(+)